eukprot:g5508.t1
MTIPSNNSLVKYNNPTLVLSTNDSKKDNKGKKSPKKGKSADKKASQTEDVLNSILPPKEWTEKGQLWTQFVSSTPATRLDVINLQEQLDLKLQQRQARETGICPIREELYVQCFDELIRQVTINCSERGLLLLRVRDEIRMTVSAYQTLYESSIAFGMRKALMAEQRKADLEARIKQLQLENDDLQKEVNNMTQKCVAIENRERDRRQADSEKHQDQVSFLKKANAQLKGNLENLLSIPKS